MAILAAVAMLGTMFGGISGMIGGGEPFAAALASGGGDGHAAAPAGHDGAHGAAAAGDHGGGEHKGGGLPQLNPAYFPSQLFWLVICFSILYFLIAGVALPRVTEVIENRDSRIAHDIDRADEMRNESAELALEIEKRLTAARKEAHGAIALVAAEAEVARSKAMGEVELEVERRLAAAEERISRARQKALKDVGGAAAELAGAVMVSLAGAQVGTSAIAEVVAESMRERV